MKKALIAILLFSFAGFSQKIDVEWGPTVKTKTAIGEMYLINGKSFIASTGGRRNTNIFSIYKSLALESTTTMRPVVNQKPTAFEGQFEFDGKILVFTSQDNSEKTTKTLYVHEYDKSAQKEIIVEGVKVASFNFDKTNKRRSGYTLITSKNKEKICVTYYSNEKRSKDKEKGIFGYYILDADLKVQSEGTFADILEEKGESIKQYTLSNDGELFIITELNKADEPASLKFYKVTGDEINTLDFKLQGNYISNQTITIDKNDNFVITGFYGKPYVKNVTKGTGVKGVFFVIMDPKTEEVLNSGFNEFDDSFILEGLSQRQKDKANKKKEKKGTEPSLANYRIRHFEPTEDGGSFGVAEEYYVIVTTSTNPKTGATTTTYHYYYNDIIAFKLDKEGAMEWKKKIQKYQHSTNDGGYFSSFTMKQTDDFAYILFNDNIKNYDPTSRKFLDKEIPQAMSLSSKKNVVALLEINLKSGNVDRTIFSGLKEMQTRLVPKHCYAEENAPSILMYTFSGKNQKIGKITFE